MIDIKLEKRLINGDEAALNELITALAPIVAGALGSYFGGALPLADIEEITADAFITLWYERAKLKAWAVKNNMPLKETEEQIGS